MDDKTPKPRKTAKTDGVRKIKDHVAVRLEPEVVAEIDAVALELVTPWLQARRSDALRMLLLEGLKAHSAEKAATQKRDPVPVCDEAPKRPKSAKKDRVLKPKDHVAVRLEPELVAAIDAVALELSTAWRQARRSDALRMLLLKGLQVYKAEKAATPKRDPDPTT